MLKTQRTSIQMTRAQEHNDTSVAFQHRDNPGKIRIVSESQDTDITM